MRAVSLLLALGLGSLLSDEALAEGAVVEGGVEPLAGEEAFGVEGGGAGEDAGGHEPADRAGGEAFAASGDSAMDFCDKLDNAELRDQCYLKTARNINCPGGWHTVSEGDVHVEQCLAGSSNTDSRDAGTGGNSAELPAGVREPGHELADRADGEAFAASGDSAMDFCDKLDNAELRDQCYLKTARNINCPGGWHTVSEGDVHVEQCLAGSSNTDSRDAGTGGNSAMDFCDKIDNAGMRDRCYLETARNINCPGGWYTAIEDELHAQQCFASNIDSSESIRNAGTGGGGNSVGGSGSDG